MHQRRERSARIGRAAVVVALFLGAALRGYAEVSTYFDPVDSPSSNTVLQALRVMEVYPESRWAKAGIRVGDTVLGRDGSRLRGLRDMWASAYVARTTSVVRLNFLRDGKRFDVTVNPDPAVRREELVIWPENRRTIPRLLRSVPDLPESIIGLTLTSDDTTRDAYLKHFRDLLNSDGSLPWNTAFNVLTCLSPRTLNAIDTVLERPDKTATVPWLKDFVIAHFLLARERYAEAARLLNGPFLRIQHVDPFLDQVVEFYRRIATTPPSEELGVPLDRYGVDAVFFVLNYPYPVLPERRTTAFSSDPDYAHLFDMATTDDTGSPPADLAKAAYDGVVPLRGCESYVQNVKMSFLAPESQGGWPYRSAMLFERGSNWELVDQLLVRLKEKPERSVETALSLVAPSYIGEEPEAFKKAFTIIYAAGTREAACAHEILLGVKDVHTNVNLSLDQTRLELDCFLPKAPFYRWLAKQSPRFGERVSRGSVLRVQQRVVDLAYYCASMPVVLLDAVERWSRRQ